eukprot:TRINITY_DN38435_c0_g1_i1.p1 TRINITY_DN38435_c0_g1~~TRINITY_DN38435_c0_g1_i1.p1  ORF type:complete len:240 (-),score=70.98 TRINITY_DN38435_c0_g1_i1:40-738(-)
MAPKPRRKAPPSAAERALKKLGVVVKEQHRDYAVISGALDAKSLQKLRRSKCKRERGGVYKSRTKQARQQDNKFRSSSIAWLLPRRVPWLAARLAAIAQHVGRLKWPRLLPPKWTAEPVQDAEYAAGDHYSAWHVDSSRGSPTEKRELTVVAMVTPKTAYTGGEFQVKLPCSGGRKQVRSLRLEAADAIVFPAKRLLHRVGRVKSGNRRTLVYWAARKDDDDDADSDSESEG